MTIRTNSPAEAAYLTEALSGCFSSRRYFASGSNRTAEIQGLTRSGCDFGVAAPEMMSSVAGSVAAKPAMADLIAAAPTGVRCFVDSGAFSEMDFPENAAPVVARPMGRIEWRRVFACYAAAAEAFGARCFIVAPDRIASQAVTLERQERYGHALRAIAARTGCKVLVPVQKGEISMADFYAAELATLGLPADQTIPAIPMKKDATPLADAVAFIAAVKPARVHLLGLGPKRRAEKGAPSYTQIVEAIEAAHPGIEIMCDSVLMSAISGRGNGRKITGKRRPLTVAMDVVKMSRPDLAGTARRAFAIECLADMARAAAAPAVAAVA